MNLIKKLVATHRFGAFVLAASALTAGATGKAMGASGTLDGPLDDAQIVHRVVEFDRAEVQAADAVKAKFSSPLFWQFAQRMGTDHAAVDEKFRGLSAGTPQPVDAGRGEPDLLRLAGDDLEKAYVDREIRSHEVMLAALERELIPNASSVELRRELVGLVTQVKAHLEHARYVQGFLPQVQQAQANTAG